MKQYIFGSDIYTMIDELHARVSRLKPVAVSRIGMVIDVNTSMFDIGDILVIDESVPGGLRKATPETGNAIFGIAMEDAVCLEGTCISKNQL